MKEICEHKWKKTDAYTDAYWDGYGYGVVEHTCEKCGKIKEEIVC